MRLKMCAGTQPIINIIIIASDIFNLDLTVQLHMRAAYFRSNFKIYTFLAINSHANDNNKCHNFNELFRV